MSYPRGGLGAIPRYVNSTQPDPVAYAIQENVIHSPDEWNAAMADSVGTLATNPELLALARAYDAARSSAAGTAALPPDDLVANMRQNGYGLPAGTPAAILNRYGTAWEKYFRAFLGVFQGIPDAGTVYPSKPAPVVGPDTRYPVGVQLIMGWRVPMPNDGLLRDAWPVVPLSPIVGYRIVQPTTDGLWADGGVKALSRPYVVRQLPAMQYDELARQTGWYPLVFSETVPGVSFPTQVKPDADTWSSVQADETALLALLNSSIPGAALPSPWGPLPVVGPAPGVSPDAPATVQPWTDASPRPSTWTDATAPSAPRADVPLVQRPDGVWIPAGAVPTPGGGYTMPGPADGGEGAGEGAGGIQAAGMGGLIGLALLGLVLAGGLGGKRRVHS